MKDEEEMPANGTMFIGEKGKILNDRIMPESIAKEAEKLPKSLLRPQFPKGDIVIHEWVAAMKGGPAASCNFDVAGELTEVALLGNLATRTAKKIYWDPENLKIPNNEEANNLIREPYRSGWSLEE